MYAVILPRAYRAEVLSANQFLLCLMKTINALCSTLISLRKIQEHMRKYVSTTYYVSATSSGTGCTLNTNSGTGCTLNTNSGTGCTLNTNFGTGCTLNTNSGTGCTRNTNSGTGCTRNTNSGTGCTLTLILGRMYP